MAWTASDFWNQNPPLTSEPCAEAIAEMMSNSAILNVATEASSHPTGLTAVAAQPFVYAGGGLGNLEECRALPKMQVCLATTGVGGLTFASVCVPDVCTADDLASSDFHDLLVNSTDVVSSKDDSIIATNFVILYSRICQLNWYLMASWSCGEYQVEWKSWPVGIPYVCLSSLFLLFWLLGSRLRNGSKRRKRVEEENVKTDIQITVDSSLVENGERLQPTELISESTKKAHSDGYGRHPILSEEYEQLISIEANARNTGKPGRSGTNCLAVVTSFLSAWSVADNYQKLTLRREKTAALDGLRFWSISWVILGHVMAIQSSSGAGYNNPADFLPPSGWLTTLSGQLLFSSRFAVDTFLTISGYLVVHVMLRMSKLRPSSITNAFGTYGRTLPVLVFGRVCRIVPLYFMVLGFWIVIAPHLGGGPFWYQWQPMLEACEKLGWTNMLFINNFLPFGLRNTETCFYHSWYLAVDLQLFLVAPLLVYLYQSRPKVGMAVTLSLIMISVWVTFYLSFARGWSINTFDGAAVVRFDVEGYAKPHVRAQAYFTGVLLAMILDSYPVAAERIRPSWKHQVLMATSVGIIATLTFITVTGAYSRRPCGYEEDPQVVECGSTWSHQATYLYTGSSRALWAWSVGWIMGLCLRGQGGLVQEFLSWRIWTPLAHLSFGAYLIHPVIIFVWQLGDRQKQSFRLLVFFMNYISVAVVSFGASLLFALVVELPCANLFKRWTTSKQRDNLVRGKPVESSGNSNRSSSLSETEDASSLLGQSESESYASSATDKPVPLLLEGAAFLNDQLEYIAPPSPGDSTNGQRLSDTTKPQRVSSYGSIKQSFFNQGSSGEYINLH